MEQTQVLFDATQAAYNIAADHTKAAHTLALAAAENLRQDQFEQDAATARLREEEHIRHEKEEHETQGKAQVEVAEHEEAARALAESLRQEQLTQDAVAAQLREE